MSQFTRRLLGLCLPAVLVRQLVLRPLRPPPRSPPPPDDQDKLPGRLQGRHVAKSRDAGPVNFIG